MCSSTLRNFLHSLLISSPLTPNNLNLIIFLSAELQPLRAKIDWSGCCQMAVQEALWLAKRLSLNLNFSFLNRIHYLYQVAAHLYIYPHEAGWTPFQTPILPQKKKKIIARRTEAKAFAKNVFSNQEKEVQRRVDTALILRLKWTRDLLDDSQTC